MLKGNGWQALDRLTKESVLPIRSLCGPSNQGKVDALFASFAVTMTL